MNEGQLGKLINRSVRNWPSFQAANGGTTEEAAEKVVQAHAVRTKVRAAVKNKGVSGTTEVVP